jgi:hypothetical protein
VDPRHPEKKVREGRPCALARVTAHTISPTSTCVLLHRAIDIFGPRVVVLLDETQPVPWRTLTALTALGKTRPSPQALPFNGSLARYSESDAWCDGSARTNTLLSWTRRDCMGIAGAQVLGETLLFDSISLETLCLGDLDPWGY